MRLEIPVVVDLNGIDGIVDEIKCLQKYKLSDDDDMDLVSLDDVAEILINHIEAKRKSEPQRMRGKWINEGIYGEGHSMCCIRCSNPLCNFHYIGYLHDYNFCPMCGVDMRGEEDGNQS